MPEKGPEDFSRSATIRERENLLHIFRKLIEHQRHKCEYPISSAQCSGAPHWKLDIGYWQQFHFGNILQGAIPRGERSAKQIQKAGEEDDCADNGGGKREKQDCAGGGVLGPFGEGMPGG